MTKANDAIHSTAANARAVLNKGALGCCVAERLEAGQGSGREALWLAHASQAACQQPLHPGGDQWHIMGLKVAPFQQLLTRRNGRRRGRMRRGRRVGRGQHGGKRQAMAVTRKGAPDERHPRRLCHLFGLYRPAHKRQQLLNM